MKTHFKTTLLLLVCLVFNINSYAQTPINFIEADDSNIQYTGRIDFTNPKTPTYTFPGVSISAKFTGTSISADFKDFGSGGSSTTNYYNVFVDNVFIKVLKVLSTTTNYMLASSLSNSSHTILITKRTESSVGKSSFKGFYIEGTSLETPDSKPTNKIEFIGDSWTCGYGNEYSGAGANTGFTSKNEDNYSAWGAITSRRLNAQYHCTAYSGRGLYRNNDGNTTTVIPNIYNRIFPDDASLTWNYSNYIPDVIVIHLGSNDFANEQSWATNSSPLDSASYVNKYIEFITNLRSAYGSSTKIICVNGSSISLWSGFDQYNRWNNYMTAIYDHFIGLSDNNIYKFKLATQDAPYGEDWHPAKHEHIHMADQITPYIQQITGWQDCNGVSSGNAYLDDCKVCVAGNTGKTACAQENLSTNEIEIAKNPLIVSPNPAINTIVMENVSDQNNWIIFNALGKIMLSGKGKTADISTLNTGIYYLISVEAETHSATTFIKQ